MAHFLFDMSIFFFLNVRTIDFRARAENPIIAEYMYVVSYFKT